MTIRRINYTSRHRIEKGHVRVSLVDAQSRPARIRATVDLPDGLPPEARVFVEAYQRTTRMRFDFGTVASPGFPEGSALLSEFDEPEAVQFALKVTGSGGARDGMLLADRDGIQLDACDADEDRETILPVAPRELGEEFWRVEFDNSGPTLAFNRRLEDWKSFAADPRVRSLVYPAVLRVVLTRILIIDDWVDLEDREDWRSRWLLFARTLAGVGDLAEASGTPDRVAWIEDVLVAFSHVGRFVTLNEQCF
jgi:hypothetical protein